MAAAGAARARPRRKVSPPVTARACASARPATGAANHATIATMLPAVVVSLALLASSELGSTPAAAGCITATSLVPMSGTGEVVTFTATYSHCEGATALRVVQLWIGDEVTPEAMRVNLGYEAGVFSLESASTCALGEAKVLQGPYADFDCAAATVTPSGNDLIVTWPLSFDAAVFPGPHGVFFDAKGGTGDPEPRLGWTEMGTFTVAAAGADGSTDAGGSQGSGSSSGSSPDDAGASSSASDGAGIDITAGMGPTPHPSTGCTCHASATMPVGWALVVFALVLGRRRR